MPKNVDARGKSNDTANRGLHVPSMDGLRAIACLAVFGVHWQQMTGVASTWGPIDFARLLENGNTGVALFMILSGFLLALPVFASTPQQRVHFSLREFWRRRGIRILPAYYACLIALVLVTSHWRSLRNLLDVLLHATFLHNMTQGTLYSISPPFWALAPIVQFYAVFALVIFALRVIGRLSNGAILATFAGIAIISQGLVTAMAKDSSLTSSSAWFGQEAMCLMHSLPAHACIFALGVFAAWAHGKLPSESSTRFDAVIVVSSLLCLAILATTLDDRLQIPGGRYNFPVVPLLLFAIVLAAPRGRISRHVLEMRMIVQLGLISYAFYLFHLPVMSGIRKFVQGFDLSVADRPYVFAIISAGLTVIASAVFSYCFERPLAKRLRSRTVFANANDPRLSSSHSSSDRSER